MIGLIVLTAGLGLLVIINLIADSTFNDGCGHWF